MTVLFSTAHQGGLMRACLDRLIASCKLVKKELWFHLRFSWFLRLVFFRFHFWFLGFGFSVSASVSVLDSLHDDALLAFVVELRVGRFGQLTSDLDRLLLGLFFWAARLRGQLSHGRFDRFLSWRDLHWIHFGRHCKFW